MFKRFLTAATVIVLISGAVQAQQSPMLKPVDAIKDSTFAQANTADKIAKINQMIIDKKINSYDFSEYLIRLFSEELAAIQGAKAKLDRYSQIRAQYDKLPSTYELEKTMIMEYLATDPAASQADITTKMKLVNDLKELKIVSWPGMADIATGLLTYHLATDVEFQKKTPQDKILYLRDLETRGIVGSLTTADFIKGISAKHLGTFASDKVKDEFFKIKGQTGFFAESVLTKAYFDISGQP